MLKFPKTGKRFDNAIPHRAKPNFLGTIINKIMHEKKSMRLFSCPPT